jgi:aspartate ammonia-lyase
MPSSRGDFRIERDFLGEVRVPAQAYYGAQTQRAIENFPSADSVFRGHSSRHLDWSSTGRHK